MDILDIFIKLTLIIFPLGEIARIQFGNNIALNLLDIIVASVALLYIVKKIKQQELPKNPIIQAISLFIGIAIISLLVNLSWLKTNQAAVALLYLLRWISYAIIYFSVKETLPKKKKSIANLLVIAGGALLTLGYLQLIVFPSLQPIYNLGWDRHLYRMVSTFLDPNFFGTFLVLYLIYILGHIQLIRSDNKKRKLLFCTIAIFTIIAIFLTYSRSAILSLVTSTIIYFLLINKKRLIVGTLLIIIVGILCILPFSHIENLNLLRSNSSKARLETWRNASKIFQKNIILGVGFNTYRYAQIKYNLRRDNTSIASHADAGSDNSLLFVLATTGIIGFISYGLIWGKLLENAYNNQNQIYSKIVLASTGGIFISSLFINSLFYPSIMLWIWIIAGLID
jgi:O-antigen ligase